ncbi:MAG: hypothetical protein K8T20_09320 [Planctomycetes bacterium]|nr:hypothetical protein [Planctomycetota bacterium]
MKRPVRTLFTLALAAALLFAVHYTQTKIDRTPEKQEMVATNPFGRMPPAQYMAEYTAAMLLGGMRAPAIDYLWIQYGKAEKARQYVEMNAILEIILRLQPNFADVWIHLAWAKAYNIAAQQESAEDRWRWVKAGFDNSCEAVRRNPSSEKLLFQKGYMLWHRLPQERSLMDRYRQVTGHDVFEDAARTFRDAIDLAQSKGRDNTIPPADGMMQDAYMRWSFELMRRGEFARAAAVLHEGHDVFVRQMTGRPVAEMNLKTTQLFLDLLPVFESEKEFVRRLASGEDVEDIRIHLLETYASLDRQYYVVKGAGERIVELTGVPFTRAFALARSGKGADAADFLGKTALPLYSSLSVRIDKTENPFWSELVRFVQRLQAALRAETDGPPGEALKKYEEIREEFRYNVPVDAPQWREIEKRASELRGR